MIKLITIIFFLVVFHTPGNPDQCGEQLQSSTNTLVESLEANKILISAEEQLKNEIKTLKAALENQHLENALLLDKNMKQLQVIFQQQQLLQIMSVQSEENMLLVQSLNREIQQLRSDKSNDTTTETKDDSNAESSGMFWFVSSFVGRLWHTEDPKESNEMEKLMTAHQKLQSEHEELNKNHNEVVAQWIEGIGQLNESKNNYKKLEAKNIEMTVNFDTLTSTHKKLEESHEAILAEVKELKELISKTPKTTRTKTSLAKVLLRPESMPTTTKQTNTDASAQKAGGIQLTVEEEELIIDFVRESQNMIAIGITTFCIGLITFCVGFLACVCRC
eukprot:TRINITY_DN3503_c1_g1_i2.p1 TRINITY_DN3503_c1_g1~~TRINITY_DN3503_c1_g1_i2.p1  ORF type:complete len:333 (-),score=58.81 TRINITY_DN3503_c1_g1_i2:101-1099(-)